MLGGNIDWLATGTMLIGVGTVMLGFAALLTLRFQWGAKRQLATYERNAQIGATFYHYYSSDFSNDGRWPDNWDHYVEKIATVLHKNKREVNRAMRELDSIGMLTFTPKK